VQTQGGLSHALVMLVVIAVMVQGRVVFEFQSCCLNRESPAAPFWQLAVDWRAYIIRECGFFY
jgi:hypothetical protein